MKHKSLVIVITGCILALLLSGNVAQPQTTPDGVATVEIAQVDNSAYPNVTLYIRVLNEKGERIPNLEQDQFNVSEDGVPVEIIDFSAFNLSPIVTFLVVDISSSMLEEGKIEGAKQAALKFIELIRPQDQVGLIAFNQSVYVKVPLTNDKDLLSQEVTMLSANGSTAWHDGVVKAVELLSTVPGRKSIVVLTDGMDNESQYSLMAATAEVQRIEIPVYAIGLGKRPSGWLGSGGYDKSELSYMAEQTGGKFYATPSASQLAQIYQEISQSTQGEYVVTYRSPRPDYDGTRRDIVVTIGQVSNTTAYVEKHLLNVKSDPLFGLGILLPILLLLCVLPLAVQASLRLWRACQVVRVSGVPLPAGSPVPASSVSAEIKLCTYCKQSIKPTARFCPACGKPVVPVGVPSATSRHCTNCGQTLRLGARFCAACGTKCG
jgi:VWFA-related protein